MYHAPIKGFGAKVGACHDQRIACIILRLDILYADSATLFEMCPRREEGCKNSKGTRGPPSSRDPHIEYRDG